MVFGSSKLRFDVVVVVAVRRLGGGRRRWFLMVWESTVERLGKCAFFVVDDKVQSIF
ncbi:hypothetical protein HanXRQr2_Chr16g0778421 [Helianthus annuus]|uniref:Uncharacterized protein n=1 Tax=Helianthus annuus TaxID=4232 RepID=A0A9K3DX70_HELAN|nr:hypothetical protein HanXRQr2_Chr16g0778421 [Helianthus annuus]